MQLLHMHYVKNTQLHNTETVFNNVSALVAPSCDYLENRTEIHLVKHTVQGKNIEKRWILSFVSKL